MENRCVCCGSIIPEGRQICRECEGSELTKESFGETVFLTREEAEKALKEMKIRKTIN